MGAIFKRELKSYFSSAIGYVFFAFFLLFAGFFFVGANIYSQSSDMSSLYQNLLVVLVIVVPILTMRMMTEDKKNKTDQALLTAPVGLPSIVLGKYFAALLVYGIAVAWTAVFAVILAFFGTIEVWVIVGSIVGLFLLGAAFIAIGEFISSLTESQIIAAVGSLAIILLLLLVDGLSSIFTGSFATQVINMFSVSTRYNNFATGLFNISDAVYFLSIAVVFIFLTTRVLQKRRWS